MLKQLSTCAENILRKNVCGQKISLYFFWNLIDGFFGDHCFKNFSWVVGTSIYVLKGRVWEEGLFLRKINKSHRYFIGTLAKSFRDMTRFFPAFFSEVYSSFTEEQFHESNSVEVEIVYFIVFRSWAKFFWTLQKFFKTVVNTWFY